MLIHQSFLLPLLLTETKRKPDHAASIGGSGTLFFLEALYKIDAWPGIFKSVNACFKLTETISIS
uniref:Uncharacterized protein n=1 Tax=Arundo donax TaxID=35708 RepID=A0A0A8Y2F7_ARUDO